MLPGQAIAAKRLGHRLAERADICFGRRIQRMGNAGLISTAWQSEGAPQRWIGSHGQIGVRDSFRPSEQSDEEHLQFLDRRIFDGFLLNLHPLLQRQKEAALTQISTQEAQAGVRAVIPATCLGRNGIVSHGKTSSNRRDCFVLFSLSDGLPVLPVSTAPFTSLPRLLATNLGSCHQRAEIFSKRRTTPSQGKERCLDCWRAGP